MRQRGERPRRLCALVCAFIRAGVLLILYFARFRLLGCGAARVKKMYYYYVVRVYSFSELLDLQL